MGQAWRPHRPRRGSHCWCLLPSVVRALKTEVAVAARTSFEPPGYCHIAVDDP
jgi:hypothetical protein